MIGGLRRGGRRAGCLSGSDAGGHRAIGKGRPGLGNGSIGDGGLLLLSGDNGPWNDTQSEERGQRNCRSTKLHGNSVLPYFFEGC